MLGPCVDSSSFIRARSCVGPWHSESRMGLIFPNPSSCVQAARVMLRVPISFGALGSFWLFDFGGKAYTPVLLVCSSSGSQKSILSVARAGGMPAWRESFNAETLGLPEVFLRLPEFCGWHRLGVSCSSRRKSAWESAVVLGGRLWKLVGGSSSGRGWRTG